MSTDKKTNMGCFAGTCGITNTAIYEGDEVVLIVFNKQEDFPTKFYYLYQEISQSLRLKLYQDEQPIKGVFLGTYNDYGWINEIEEDDENSETAQLFHRWAVELILDKEIKSIKDKKSFVCDLYAELYLLRKSPIDTTIIGVQHDGIKEVILQLKVYEATVQYLRKKLEDFRESGYSED